MNDNPHCDVPVKYLQCIDCIVRLEEFYKEHSYLLHRYAYLPIKSWLRIACNSLEVVIR